MKELDIHTLSNRDELESLGKQISVPQTLSLLSHYPSLDDAHKWKLNPILIGMPFSTFLDALLQASPVQIDTLKQEAVSEPVQHQITLLTNELAGMIKQLDDSIDELAKDIKEIDSFSLSGPDICAWEKRIGNLADRYQNLFLHFERGLEIAWHTDRSDLIQRLSQLKEYGQRALIFSIGNRAMNGAPSKGLYALLNEQLMKVYGKADDVSALHDEDPAIEALTKFGIADPQSYIEVGLLQDEEKKYNPADIDSYHALFQKAKEKLSQMGLRTVKDLKNAKIFSKKTLTEYLQTRKN